MNPRDEDERREDLTATSTSLRDDAKRVQDIEEEKQGLDPDDPRVDALSHEAERIAADIADKSRIERELAADTPPSEEAGSRTN
jgi:hypothetical protein